MRTEMGELLAGASRLLRGGFGTLLKVGVSTGLILLLLWKVDFYRFWLILREIAPAWLLLALFFKAGGVFSSILRWRVLMKGQDLAVPLKVLIASFLEGRFFGTFTPSTIGLDAYRMYDMARYSGRTAASVSVILVDKVIGLFSLSFLVAITSFAGVRFVGGKGVLSLFLIFCAPLSLSVLLLLYPGLLGRLTDVGRWRSAGWAGKVGRFVETLTLYRRHRLLIAQAVGLGILVHLATTLMYYGTALSVQAPVRFWDILFVGPLMITATVIPLSIAGIGVREGTFAFFLTRVGVQAEAAILLAFLGFLVDGFISLFGVLIFVLRSHAYRREGWTLGAEGAAAALGEKEAGPDPLGRKQGFRP
jgi:uncharacterized membrane protein YbhN (UPF0104 family)